MLNPLRKWILHCITFLILFHLDACIRSRAVVRLSCPPSRQLIAGSRATTAVLAWKRQDFKVESTHPVKGLYQTVPDFGARADWYRSFREGTHLVEYKAVDDSGNFDRCSFTVTVRVVRCPTLYNPQFGSLSCNAGQLFGSRCKYRCIPGYAIMGMRTLQCKQDGTWSEDPPFCRIMTCADPGTPLYGTRFCTTATHAFGSICSFACSQGYKLVGNSTLICRAKHELTYWSGPTPVCKRITPPTIEMCPTTLQITTSQVLTEVQKPLIVFRTVTGDTAPFTCTQFGSRDSHNFTIGDHIITCRAFDPVFGEQYVSICEFTIHVRANPCRPLPQPRNGILLCSRAHGGGGSAHDTVCRLFCHKGFDLPRTNAPMVNTRIYDCDHSGQWQPSNKVPSCVKPRRPQELKLPSEIYYESSGCGDAKRRQELRSKFEAALQTVIRTQNVCSATPGDCIVDEVSTDCKSKAEMRPKRHLRPFWQKNSKYTHVRRRRLVEGHGSVVLPSRELKYIFPIQFHFGTRLPERAGQWPEEWHKAAHRLFGMFDFFEKQVVEGKFVGPRVYNMELKEMKDSLTFAPIKAICDIGFEFKKATLMCVPCGAGTYFDTKTDKCTLCPPGRYQDNEGQFSCKICPKGTSSVETGSTNTSQCLEVDECQSSPCLHNGNCEDGRASYTCTCQPGFSGKHCELRVYDCKVHACQNGGRCIPEGEHNYTCFCPKLYTGKFCEYQTVNGGWSTWSPWTPCSKSCAGGVMSRNRTCDNPPPTHGGQTCMGASLEMKVCNEHDCPVCKKLRRPYQGHISCSRIDSEDVITCTISCPEGYGFSAPVLSRYTCGRNTSYLWPHESPDNPRCVLPACARASEAKEAVYEFATEFPTRCESRHKSLTIRKQIYKRATDITKHIHCIQSGKCSLDEPRVRGCSNGRHKRSVAGNDTGIVVQVSITYHGGISSLSGKETAEFQEAANEMQLLGRELVNKTMTGDIYLIVDGKKVVPDAKSTVANNGLSCPRGMTQAFDGEYCVECSPGSYYEREFEACAYCDVGFYQPKSAQTSCRQCPEGKTTFGRGAVYQRECYTNGTEPPVFPPEDLEEDDPGGRRVLLQIITPVLLCVLLVSVGVIAAVVLMRKRRQYEKYDVVRRKKKEEEEQAAEEKGLYRSSQSV